MRQGFLLILSLLFAQWASAQQPISIRAEEGANPWTHLNLQNNPSNFQFAVVTDRTGGMRPGVFEDAVRKLNLLQPEFVMSVGDLIPGYSDKAHEIDTQWDEFTGFVQQLKMPFFYVPGNHDISNSLQAEIWKKRFGRSYHHFVYHHVLFLCLNSEDPPGTHISQEQIEYVKRTLDENQDVRWTLVFLHKPLWTDPEPTGWQEVEAMLKRRRHTVFAGHNHTYTNCERNDSHYIILATTGGGTQLRGPVFGEFDHVVWITMTDEGPVLANLMLDGIWDENIRTEDVAVAMDAVLGGRAVRADPIRCETLVFSKGTARYRLTNNSDVPMRIALQAVPVAGLQFDPSAVEKTVNPNSVEWAELQVAAAKALAAPGLGSFSSTWQITYEFPNHKPVQIPGSRACPVEAPFTIPKVGMAPVIDGQLTDWTALPFVVERPAEITRRAGSWKGPQDGAFHFSLAYDERFLYLGVECQDDQVSASSTDSRLRSRDGIEVWLDARPSGGGMGDKEGALHLQIADGKVLDSEPGEPPVPSGIVVQSSQADHGQSTEVAIPVSYLEGLQGGGWKQVRVNVAFNDRDDDGTAEIWWRPEWEGDDDYEGSGLFTREP
jgi:hypothetical protein